MVASGRKPYPSHPPCKALYILRSLIKGPKRGGDRGELAEIQPSQNLAICNLAATTIWRSCGDDRAVMKAALHNNNLPRRADS